MPRFASLAPRQRLLVGVILIVLVVLAGGAYAWLHGAIPGQSSAAKDAQAGGKDDSGVGILLDLAKTAVNEKRLVAPAGSNAYEFYLSVLQLDPQNKPAMDQLHESFEEASAAVERDINNPHLFEAERDLSLLREFDCTNYSLSLLGGMLDAQRQIQIRQDEARAAVIQAQRQQQAAGSGGAMF
jgi:protein TonB